MDEEEEAVSHAQTQLQCQEGEESLTHSRPPPLPQPGGGVEAAMKIAWRYQSLPKVQHLPFSNRFGHFYDLTKRMPQARVEAVQRIHFNALEPSHTPLRQEPPLLWCVVFARCIFVIIFSLQ